MFLTNRKNEANKSSSSVPKSATESNMDAKSVEKSTSVSSLAKSTKKQDGDSNLYMDANQVFQTMTSKPLDTGFIYLLSP